MTSNGLEVWVLGAGIPGSTARAAQRAEAEGWHGFGIVDSQSLAADPFVELTVAAKATSHLKLGTAVTNPVTRHPAVMANAAISLDANSDGRVVIGIGRGDSSLAHLGLAPAPLQRFETFLRRLQGYLRGDDVPFEVGLDGDGQRWSAETLHLHAGPTASRLRWARGREKVPVEVAGSGPRVIEIGARLADGVALALGAATDRLAWGVELARRVRAAHAPNEPLRLAAYVPVIVNPSRSEARRLAAGVAASSARFSVMHGQIHAPVSESVKSDLHDLVRSYDMTSHVTQNGAHVSTLSDETIDTFAIAGPPAYCIDRLAQLTELGIQKLLVMGPARGADRAAATLSHRLLVEQVLPAFAGAART